MVVVKFSVLIMCIMFRKLLKLLLQPARTLRWRTLNWPARVTRTMMASLLREVARAPSVQLSMKQALKAAQRH